MRNLAVVCVAWVLCACGGSGGGGTKPAPIVDPEPKPKPEPEPEPLIVALQIYNAGDTWVQSIYLHPTRPEQLNSGVGVDVVCGCPGKYGYYPACSDCTVWKNIWIEPGETRNVGHFQAGSYDFIACFGEYFDDQGDGLYDNLDYAHVQYTDVILDYYEHGAVLVLPAGTVEPRIETERIYWNVLIENNTSYPWKSVYWRASNAESPSCWQEFGPVAYSEHCEILHQAEGLYDFAWQYDNPDAEIVLVEALPIPFPFLSENGWTVIDQGPDETPVFMDEPEVCP
jgi:hypothetical protein